MWRTPSSWFNRRGRACGARRTGRPAFAVMLAITFLVLVPCLAPRRLAAQEPRFLIETITVQGVKGRGAQAIVVSQSYLKTGQSYSERELQEAAYRVKRLPFVVEADLALRKGTVRGSYELVMSVEETRPLFLEATPTATYVARTPGLPPPGTAVQWTSQETLALRQFVGAEGLAFESAAYGIGDQKTLTAGYTQYSLFGNGSYATLQGSETYDPHLSPAPALSATVGIPLTANLTLVVTPQWSRSSGGAGDVFQSADQVVGNLGLIYRTTDDPIIPTRGADVEATLQASDASLHETLPGIAAAHGSLQTEVLDLTATRYWPVTPRQSLGLNGQAELFRDEASSGLRQIFAVFSEEAASLALLYSASPWDSATARRLGDLRFEASVAGSALRASVPVFFAGKQTQFQPSATIGAVFRDDWGLLRFSFVYLGRATP